MKDKKPPANLISCTEAATILERTVSYVRRLARTGALPGTLVGNEIGKGAWVFYRETVEQFAKDHPRRDY